MTDTVLVYRGRPITDLTKDELVDAMTWAFQEIEYQRERADRFLNAAALAEPEPEGPTDEEILELSQWHEVSYTLSNGDVIYPMQEGTDMRDAVLSFTKAVLTRWGK